MITITEATIAKLDVQKGDTLVLTFPHRLTPEVAAYLMPALERAFGDTPVVVLQEGARLSVVSSREDGPDPLPVGVPGSGPARAG